MKVHHVGYLVADIDAAVTEFLSMGYEVRQEKLYDSSRKVYLCFMENSGVMIELVSPSEDCRLFTSLQKRIGNAPYHICYFPDEGNGFDAAIEKLQSEGFFMAQPPEAAVAFGGRRVAFMMSPETGLIEILEAETAEMRLTEMNEGAGLLTRLDQNCAQNYEDFYVGQQAVFIRSVTEDMMREFLELSGDTNPLHNDEHFAQSKGYPSRVVYGILTASLYSCLAELSASQRPLRLSAASLRWRCPDRQRKDR